MSREEAHRLANEADRYAREGKEKKKAKAFLRLLGRLLKSADPPPIAGPGNEDFEPKKKRQARAP